MGDFFLVIGFMFMAAAAVVGGMLFVRCRQAESPAWTGFENTGVVAGYFRDAWRLTAAHKWLVFLPIGLYIANQLIAYLLYYISLSWMGYDWDIVIRSLASPSSLSAVHYLQKFIEGLPALNNGMSAVLNNLFVGAVTGLMVCFFWTVKKRFRNVIVASNMHNVSYFQTILQITFFALLAVGLLQFVVPVSVLTPSLPEGLARLEIVAGLACLVGFPAYLAVASAIQGIIIVSVILGIRGEKLRRRRILNQALLKLKPLLTLNLLLFLLLGSVRVVNELLIQYADVNLTLLMELFNGAVTAVTFCAPFAIVMSERNVRGAFRKTFRVLGANKWRYAQLVGIGSLALALLKLVELTSGLLSNGYLYIGAYTVLGMICVLLSMVFTVALLKFFLTYYDVDGWDAEFAAFEREAACTEEKCAEDGESVDAVEKCAESGGGACPEKESAEDGESARAGEKAEPAADGA